MRDMTTKQERAGWIDGRLAELYPTHAAYVEAVTASADETVEAGFLLDADRDAIVTEAERSGVGR